MFAIASCALLYLLLNTVLITLDVNHVIITIQLNKHFYSDKITLMETCLWCVVCIHLTVGLVNYIFSLFYVYILGIMLWLSLHSVFCIPCLYSLFCVSK